jgi:hypothetical protein
MGLMVPISSTQLFTLCMALCSCWPMNLSRHPRSNLVCLLGTHGQAPMPRSARAFLTLYHVSRTGRSISTSALHGRKLKASSHVCAHAHIINACAHYVCAQRARPYRLSKIGSCVCTCWNPAAVMQYYASQPASSRSLQHLGVLPYNQALDVHVHGRWRPFLQLLLAASDMHDGTFLD